MKLLFDGNLPAVLVRHLDELYPGSTHVGRIGLERGSDQKVWDYAETQGHIIATKDSDFQDLSALYGHPPKVVWTRRGNCSTSDVADLLREYHTTMESFENDEDTSLLMLF